VSLGRELKRGKENKFGKQLLSVQKKAPYPSKEGGIWDGAWQREPARNRKGL